MENGFGNPYTNQIFQEAVERSDFAIVKTLLKYGVYLRRNQRNRNRLTALQQSVLDGNGRMAVLLLENGADIEAKTSNGWTSLHIAAALGNLDILTSLINHCACLLAMTKNEELPIDLAATREIIIKLAKEMSRVGSSELAQCYMKKLAAREGVFYMLSANTLLDLACDDNYDKSYSNGPPCYVWQDDEQNEQMFVHEQNATNAAPNTTYWPLQDAPPPPHPQTLQYAQDPHSGEMWLEQQNSESPTYLSYSSGYITEVVFDSNSGEYSKVRRSVSMSSGSSPRIKYSELVVESSKNSLANVITPEEEIDNSSRYNSLARSTTSRRHSNASKNVERSNTIELLIDYSHFEDVDDLEEDQEDIAALEQQMLNIKPPPAIIDECEEGASLATSTTNLTINQDDHFASTNDILQNMNDAANNSIEPSTPQFKRASLTEPNIAESQFKTQLIEPNYQTGIAPAISNGDNVSLHQYDGDIFDGYLGTPMSTSMTSSISNDIQYKSDLNDPFPPPPVPLARSGGDSLFKTEQQQNADHSFKSEPSSRSIDNQFKPEPSTQYDYGFKMEPTYTADNLLYKNELSPRNNESPFEPPRTSLENQYKNIEPPRTADNLFITEPPPRRTDTSFKSDSSSRTSTTEPPVQTNNNNNNNDGGIPFKIEPPIRNLTDSNPFKSDAQSRNASTSSATTASDIFYTNKNEPISDNNYTSLSSSSSPFTSLLSSTIESQDMSLNARYRRYEPSPDAVSTSSEYDMKNRNVRFDNSDAANEFCNCPNCKKLGYAFSPDIRSTGRRVMHFGAEQVVLPPNQVMMSDLQLQRALEVMQSKGYPPNARLYHDEMAGDRSLCYTQGHSHKPRKRKKKLFSGIRSIFKDSIKVQRGGGGMENSPVVDDAGILFAFSLRDRSKSKEIKNRFEVRRSNSFSGGCGSPHGAPPDMMNTYTHEQLVPPPIKFSDAHYGEGTAGDHPRKKNFYPGEHPPPPPHHSSSLHATTPSHAPIDTSLSEDSAGPFKQFYHDQHADGGVVGVGPPCDVFEDKGGGMNQHAGGNHMSHFSSPLYESQSVIEEHSCEYANSCDCDGESLIAKEATNISHMMSKMNVGEPTENEKLNDESTTVTTSSVSSKFASVASETKNKKDSFSGKSL